MGIISANKAISLEDELSDALRVLVGTRNFISGDIAIGGTTSKVKLATAVDYCINGVLYHKAITDNLFVLSGTTIPASTTGRFLLCLDASGASVVVQGTATTNGNLPEDANGFPTACPVGEIKIVMGSGGGFTPGSTALTGGNVTSVTYTNLSCLPVGGVGTL
jgi:hypothetical protein